jgi:hypothetical protein
MFDTVFEALVSDKPLQKHVISLAHMLSEMINKPKKAATKKEKVNTVIP